MENSTFLTLETSTLVINYGNAGKKNNYAVPATNFVDLDSARSFVEVAEKRKLPLILAYAESHKNIISLEEAALIGNFLAENSTVPVVLHLDHGMDKQFITEAIRLGFSSVMIDASSLSFSENIVRTKEIIEIAHQYNVSVEAELGHVGSNDSQKFDSIYTETKDVVDFIKQTGVDSLAISIGTAHGIYKGTPKLNFERLSEIANKTNVPLVLHGGSSTGDTNLNRCATHGISKINIFSDFGNSAIQYVNKHEFTDYLSLKSAINGCMKEVLNHYYDVFETVSFNEKVI